MDCCSLTGRISNRREWLGTVLLALGCSKRKALPIFNSVPSFQLISQSGARFDSVSLRGAPWLASFFFASCNGPCPRMNTAIHDLQEQTYNFKGLKIVSFTVDPEHDTPEILAAYAKRYKADPARWFFLTGERAAISAVARDGFQVGALDTAQGHSTRILLVDGENRVRGHFPEAEKEALLAGIAAVYEEGK